MNIRAIAAIDKKRGLANEHGIPWKLPGDIAYVREKTQGGAVIMGYGTYTELTKPLVGRRSFVFYDGMEPLREGFEAVTDLVEFMKNPPDNPWLFGGAGLFAQTIQYANELYLTQLKEDFECTKFFPEYRDDFELSWESDLQRENEVRYTFQIWKRKD